MINIENRHIFNTGMKIIDMVNNVKRLLGNSFEWIKVTSEFNEDLIKNSN